MIRLKELRNQKHISQQALADVLHVRQQSVYKYEHGMAEPDIEMLKACADYFQISVDYLIGFSDIPCHIETMDSNFLTEKESHLLQFYRQLTPTAQELIQKLIQELSFNIQNQP